MKLSASKLNIKIINCQNFFLRLFGFMFKFKKINYGLLFNNCSSIHTFFMFQNIDVIMVDNNNNILYQKENLKPWRIILPKKGVKNVYELPLGSIKKITKGIN